MRNPSLVARKTPHRLPPGTAASASPLGEGKNGVPLDRIGTAHSPLGYAKVSQERALRNLRVVARKTPHLLLAKTPEFSSPLGEGKEAHPFEEIDTDARPLGYAKVSQERQEVAPPRKQAFCKGLQRKRG